jgi:phospholipid/cholesterol/gamma-HCH transport system substrate-binding protein
MSPTAPARRKLFTSKKIVPIAVVLVVVAGFVALTNKAALETALRSGDTITAEFDTNYQLHADESTVKLDGVGVGGVSDIAPSGHGTVLVSMKLDRGTMDKLGTEPSARVEPATILGGVYTVHLQAGGGAGAFTGGTIPIQRTATPVELDRVLEGLPKAARDGMRGSVADLDATLANGGQSALDDTLRTLPPAMRSGDPVLNALRGTRPDTDLQTLVSTVDTTAQVLSRQDGQLDDTVRKLDRVTGDLADQAPALGAAIGTLPETLRSTRAGLAGLGGSLDRLTATAPAFRPAAQQLPGLLDKLDPTLVRTLPVLQKLRPLLAETRPLLQQLQPTAVQATGVLNDVRGPVLDRVNGPIMQSVLGPWHGTGEYQGGGSGVQADHRFYQELAYLAARFDSGSKAFDQNGAFVNLALGAGTTTLPGTPLTASPLLPSLLQNVAPPQGGQR